MRNGAVAALLLLLGSSLCFVAAAEKKVLVLYGQSSIPETHGQFIKGLEAKGLKVDLKSVKDSGLKLRDHDTWLYDALVLFAPKAASEFSNAKGGDRQSLDHTTAAGSRQQPVLQTAGFPFPHLFISTVCVRLPHEHELPLDCRPPPLLAQALVATSPQRASWTLLTAASTSSSQAAATHPTPSAGTVAVFVCVG